LFSKVTVILDAALRTAFSRLDGEAFPVHHLLLLRGSFTCIICLAYNDRLVSSLCFERGATTPRSESSAWMSLTVLQPLSATKLVVYTFGTLIHFFLVVLILGNWRLRRLEWLLFGLMAALFMWYSGNLLALNIDLHYGAGPAVLSGVSILCLSWGSWLRYPSWFTCKKSIWRVSSGSHYGNGCWQRAFISQ